MNKIKSRREDLDISSCYCLTISLLAFFSVMLEDNIRKKKCLKERNEKRRIKMFIIMKKKEKL